ncbi:Dimeric alpha+beta barrel [Glarea lozoyensis ATCC 20868]|uniref:Dimeric alpha+beta barrel n=1 Tax=Glarea lozoyensis (strain ATCC 20868 / MF5171) TaxID=1116229 RepID=S3CUM6_GLAL2|nr:Dimeric alpha+beta barrel [Glarea lozoyensis ATCC 20868]EPE29320.1 Dimeric alpha+beta barrel [Glarea lozoyensis ATCC 20868]
MAPPPLNLDDVQGDILIGLPKRLEAYWFIEIKKPSEFQKQLLELIPLITSSTQAKNDEKACFDHRGNDGDLTLAGVNFAFSRKGLDELGFKEPLSKEPQNDPFEKTMLATAEADFNDRVHGFNKAWFKEFKQEIHCLIFITGDCQDTIDFTLAKVKKILGVTVQEIKLVQGKVRPGDQMHHEHFGYNDGISQPAIKGVDQKLLPGQEFIDQGIILLGRPGDRGQGRPSWTLDGSFLAFRYLSQEVPEFQDFVDDKNPHEAPKDFFGAQLVGRWKSGTPLVLAPTVDSDPSIGKNPQQNNKFDYDPHSQKLCPYAAHTRKTFPRGDIQQSVAIHRIVRRAITFGEELTPEEIKSRKTKLDRGLLFKCYQSNIADGFHFIQRIWANNNTFPFLKIGEDGKPIPKPGFSDENGPGVDGIIGQAEKGGVRQMDILNDNDPAGKVKLPKEWVISRGGEYFFSPSISQLKKKFASPSKNEL